MYPMYKTTFYNVVNPLFEAFLNFVYPPVCLICNIHLNRGGLVCDVCWDEFPKIPAANGNGSVMPVRGLTVISVWQYSEEIQKLIHEMKYFRKRSLAARLGDRMAAAIDSQRQWQDFDVIVPVPLYRTRLRERGYNQSYYLARAVAERWNKPVEGNMLKRIRPTVSQSRLSAKERWSNVENAFRANGSAEIAGRRILLVDDVCTTGATLGACAEALLDAGATSVWGLTAARA